MIIFEALAVNAGSLLTPVGNPQNILLWGRSGLTFAEFSGQMAPLAVMMMLTLLLLCWFCFPGRALQYHTGTRSPQWQPRLVWVAWDYMSFSYRAGAQARVMGTGVGGCWVYCAGAQGDSQRGLDAAVGIYGDVY